MSDSGENYSNSWRNEISKPQPDIFIDELTYYLNQPCYVPELNNYQQQSYQSENLQTINSYDGNTVFGNMDNIIYNNHENSSWSEPNSVCAISSSTEMEMYNKEANYGIPNIPNQDVFPYCQSIAFPTTSGPLTSCVENNMPSSAGSQQAGKKKRIRTAFTTNQLEHLERYFRSHPYVSAANREALSIILGISEKAIKTWFQNRRFKARHRRPEQIVPNVEF